MEEGKKANKPWFKTEAGTERYSRASCAGAQTCSFPSPKKKKKKMMRDLEAGSRGSAWLTLALPPWKDSRDSEFFTGTKEVQSVDAT